MATDLSENAIPPEHRAASADAAPAGLPRPRRRRWRPFGNPVVLKELRGRMRGARAFAVLTLYLALMSGFTALLYMLAASARDIYGYTTGGQIGRTLFTGIVGIELFLVTFIAPAFTAGAISGERERQTYDLLRTTLLPGRALIVGKLVSALAYVALLLLAAIPLQSIAFLFGGVTEAEVVLASVILLATASLLGALGIYVSAITPRTLAANVTTYAATLVITLGLPVAILVLLALFGPQLARLPLELQVLALYVTVGLLSTSPLSAAYATQYWYFETQSVGLFSQTLTDMHTGVTIQAPLLSPWILFVTLYMIVTLLLVQRAVRRVRRIDV